MKSRLHLIIALVIAAAAAATIMAGCSKHEAELSETNEAAMEALEAYMAQQEAEENETIALGHDPNAPQLDSVLIYVPGKKGGLQQIMDGVEKLTPESIFGKLEEEGLDVAGVEVKSWKVDGDDGTLELSGLKDTGNVMQICLVNTFIDNYVLDTVTIIVDGKTIVDKGEFESKYRDVK